MSRKLQLRQKTCWLFKQKVMQAMASSDQHPLEGKVEVDEFVIGQQEEGVVVIDFIKKINAMVDWGDECGTPCSGGNIED